MTRHCIGESIEGITFRDLVKDCAEEPQLIDSFNRAYGVQLQAPIAAILDDRWPLCVPRDEEFLIGCFVVFVHDQIWMRLRAMSERGNRKRTSPLASLKMTSLKSPRKNRRPRDRSAAAVIALLPSESPRSLS